MAEPTDSRRSKTKGHVLLRIKLEKRGWKQSDLVEALGLDSGYVCRLVRGERGVGLKLALDLYELLAIPPRAWLEAA